MPVKDLGLKNYIYLITLSLPNDTKSFKLTKNTITTNANLCHASDEINKIISNTRLILSKVAKVYVYCLFTKHKPRLKSTMSVPKNSSHLEIFTVKFSKQNIFIAHIEYHNLKTFSKNFMTQFGNAAADCAQSGIIATIYTLYLLLYVTKPASLSEVGKKIYKLNLHFEQKGVSRLKGRRIVCW